MTGRLPPPDPSEPGDPPGMALAAPTTVFLKGRPTPDFNRSADAILAARPGLLLVCLAG